MWLWKSSQRGLERGLSRQGLFLLFERTHVCFLKIHIQQLYNHAWLQFLETPEPSSGLHACINENPNLAGWSGAHFTPALRRQRPQNSSEFYAACFTSWDPISQTQQTESHKPPHPYREDKWRKKLKRGGSDRYPLLELCVMQGQSWNPEWLLLKLHAAMGLAT